VALPVNAGVLFERQASREARLRPAPRHMKFQSQVTPKPQNDEVSRSTEATMNAQLCDRDTWYLAMTLSERLQPHEQRDSRPSERTAVTSDYRFNRWRSQQPFDTGEHWTRRLAMDGLTNEGLLRILSEPASAVRSRFTEIPNWLQAFQEAFYHPSKSSEAMTLASSTRERKDFARIAEPLIGFAIRQLQHGIGELLHRFPDAPFDKDIALELRPDIVGQLKPMLVPTMALELNVARLEGALPGATPEERFDAFVASLENPQTALRILEEYPVLARQLTEAVIRSVDCRLEALERLCGDWEEIRSALLPCGDPGKLIRLNGSSGDMHRGGRAVLIAEFESGLRIVYKPRSLAIDVHFQKLLAWLNDHGAPQRFRILNVIDRGEYGWVEFVAAQSCKSEAEVRRFYERQGAYLALLYSLDATDFHHENLVAAGEHPVLLDLEAVFHPHFSDNHAKDAGMLAQNDLSQSVLRVGLLPLRIGGNAEAEGVDLSGLSTEGEQITPFPIPRVEGDGTDEMHLVLKRVCMPASSNRPTLEGTRIDLEDYSDSLFKGFTQTYHLLLGHRQDLLAKGGPLDRFSLDEVRVILLPTRTYDLLLGESFHPDVLRDALDRDRLFDRLWALAVLRPGLGKLIKVQIRDLSNNDIPIFTTKPGTRDLWSGSGERFPDYLEECPMASVRRRLLGLSEEDLSTQMWVIRATLATLSKETAKLRLTTYAPAKPEGMVTRTRLMSAAKKAGDWLESQARYGENDAAWIGLTLGRDSRWSLTPVGLDLYDGLPGIALFLAQLGAGTGEQRYTKLAECAINTVLRAVAKNREAITWIGGFNGWGGLVYTFTRLGDLWQREDLWQQAESAAARIPGLIERDDVLDIIGGAAGSIGALIGLYRRASSRAALNVAIQCGEHLVQRAKPLGDGIAWPAPFASGKALTGFSHGAAGEAWALQQLACATGERRFSDVAAGALAYERGLFNPQHQNWPDLRENAAGEAAFCVAWCHGAPGIGLARLSTLADGDAVSRGEIESALQATVASGPGHGHCLCHGDLGNLDLLLEAARRLDDPKWAHELQRLAVVALTDIERNGWRCGLPLDVQSPGLMTGVAGIGYQLLRLANPEQVPSVLLFDHSKDQRKETSRELPKEVTVA
jgi:type 2 lantibiotic biosynthesis protein LanM